MQTSQRCPQSGPIHIPDANLRVFLSKVRPELRRVPVDARRTVSRMPERALPVAEVGTREGEAAPWHRRGSDLQRIWILHHRLPKRFLQGGSEKGISCCRRRWREIRHAEGICERFVRLLRLRRLRRSRPKSPAHDVVAGIGDAKGWGDAPSLGKLTTALLFVTKIVLPQCLTAMRRAVLERKRGASLIYEVSNFLFITHHCFFVDCNPSGKRAGQRHSEKQ